jgi:hypothetical protein
MRCGQKKVSVSVAVPPAPVRVPSQRPLAPSVASVANYKGDNEMILVRHENIVIPELMMCDHVLQQAETSVGLVQTHVEAGGVKRDKKICRS